MLSHTNIGSLIIPSVGSSGRGLRNDELDYYIQLITIAKQFPLDVTVTTDTNQSKTKKNKRKKP